MKCPFCYSEDTMEINSRWIENKIRIKRKYICYSCSNYFTTCEELSEKTTRKVRVYRLKIGGRN